VKRLVVGVMGHVDHGKTALVRALTGMETDRLAEEKQRGISIALGFAHFSPTPETVIDLVDMPGHERFIRTMIGGASGIDAALLVIAANEGLRPQTREHAQIAALLGIRQAVIAVTKCDLAAADEAAIVADDARNLLQSLGMSVQSDVMTSIPQQTGLDHLGMALATMAQSTMPREEDGLPFLPVDRAFAIPGHGPVVTGTLRGAGLAVGDRVRLLPSGREIRIRSLQSHGNPVERGLPGQRLAVNLRDIGLADLGRGMALAAGPGPMPSRWLALRLQVPHDGIALRNGMAVHVAFATAGVAGRLRLLDRDELPAGAAAMAQVRLAEAAFLPAGEHLVIRSPDLSRTLGGGRLIDNGDRRLRRHAEGVLERLERLSEGSLDAIVARELRGSGADGVSLAEMVNLTGKAPWRIARAVEAASGSVTREGMAIAAAETRRRMVLKVRQPAEQPPDDSALEQRLADAGLTPPTPRELFADPVVAAGINRLLRRGVLLRTADRAKGKEMFFHVSALAKARETLTPLLAGDAGMTVSEIAAALGISRKFAMPLLDHLDAAGFTRRDGDLRHLARRGDDPHCPD
jgi:selenocysteine-specific elongation factor